MTRWLARWAYRFWERRNCLIADRSLLDAAMGEVVGLEGFCSRSGFLRDGRYPGGRPAERKLRARLKRLASFAREARLDEGRAQELRPIKGS